MSTYFPYIRARQFDVIAVAKVAARLSITGKITPLFEPVKTDTDLFVKRAVVFGSTNLPIALVVNPTVGELVGNQKATTVLMADLQAAGAKVLPTLIVDAATKRAQLKAFQKLLGSKGSGIFVHRGVPSAPAVAAAVRSATRIRHLFIDGATSDTHEKTLSPRARIQDGFKAQAKNAHYPAQSFFSDLHLRYLDLGFSAFGDFATVGQSYKDGGGPAYAVAIHLTEATPDGIICHHFLSTSNATSADTPGKFGEAAAKVAAFCKKKPGALDFSSACKELLRFQAAGTFPGLPTLKRISIQHHLELMSTLV